jgi:hypothetical protein
MAMLSFCGIDVSKDRLDVMVLPEQQSFAVRNDAAGWAELIARLRGFAIVAIGLEASGGTERGAMRALLAAGVPAPAGASFNRPPVNRPTICAGTLGFRLSRACCAGSASSSAAASSPPIRPSPRAR